MSRGDVLDARPQVQQPAAFGIGIVGSGNIIENAHIPAYQSAGYRIEAIASRNQGNAARVAVARNIKRVARTAEELILDPAVDVVDIAVPPDIQPDLVSLAIKNGKHVLAQKPLAETFEGACELVEAASLAGVKLAVNQNGRYDPSINALRSLLMSGELGEPLLYSLAMYINMPWQEYYKNPKYDKLMLLNMSVHHIDQMRWLFGEPKSVSAVTRKVPGQAYFGETIAQYAFQYESGLIASFVDDGTNQSDDFDITYSLQATAAAIRGRIGWPHAKPSELRYQINGHKQWTDLEFSRQWFPDAFSATMGGLLSALENGEEPENSGRDNLKTMQCVFAAYKSADESRHVRPEDISSDAKKRD